MKKAALICSIYIITISTTALADGINLKTITDKAAQTEVQMERDALITQESNGITSESSESSDLKTEVPVATDAENHVTNE